MGSTGCCTAGSVLHHTGCVSTLVVLPVLIKLIYSAILKQAGDVGTAIWSLAIALHTFSVLALEVELRSKLTSFGTLIAGWSGICAIVICGPAVANTAQRGPFCEFQILFFGLVLFWMDQVGILGSWCSISNGYLTSQLTYAYHLIEIFDASHPLFVVWIIYLWDQTLIFSWIIGTILRIICRCSWRHSFVSSSISWSIYAYTDTWHWEDGVCHFTGMHRKDLPVFSMTRLYRWPSKCLRKFFLWNTACFLWYFHAGTPWVESPHKIIVYWHKVTDCVQCHDFSNCYN